MTNQNTETEREHYMTIAPEEISHRAALCGCALERHEDGAVRLYQCPMHRHASELMHVVKSVFLWDLAKNIGRKKPSPLYPSIVRDARTALVKAEGGHA